MALQPPFPAPLPKWASWLIKAAPFIVAGLETLYDYISTADSPEEVEWRYLALRYARETPSGTVEDMAQFGFHVVNITGGQIDSTWSDSDYTAVAGHLAELKNTLVGVTDATHTLVEWRWYVRAFNPNLPIGQPVTQLDPATGKPYARFVRSGPPAALTPINQPGAGTSADLPYQTALSVTFKTPAPKHWGRVYVPGMGSGALSAPGGRWGQTTMDTLAGAFAEFIDDMQGSDFQIVIPSTQHEGKFATALQGVTEVQVDDIPDVIRRRRAKQPAVKTIGVPTP